MWGRVVSVARLARMAALSRGRAASESARDTSGPVNSTNGMLTQTGEAHLRAVLLRRGLVLHKGCRGKAEAFADRHMILVKVH